MYQVYRETAFVHALTAASLTFSIARACAEGKMTKCRCATERKSSDKRSQQFKWGGCSDNVKHGKRVTRNFLDLIPAENEDEDEVTEMLKHDSEVRKRKFDFFSAVLLFPFRPTDLFLFSFILGGLEIDLNE